MVSRLNCKVLCILLNIDRGWTKERSSLRILLLTWAWPLGLLPKPALPCSFILHHCWVTQPWMGQKSFCRGTKAGCGQCLTPGRSPGNGISESLGSSFASILNTYETPGKWLKSSEPFPHSKNTRAKCKDPLLFASLHAALLFQKTLQQYLFSLTTRNPKRILLPGKKVKSKNSIQHLYYCKLFWRQCTPRWPAGSSPSSFPRNYTHISASGCPNFGLCLCAFVFCINLFCVFISKMCPEMTEKPNRSYVLYVKTPKQFSI